MNGFQKSVVLDALTHEHVLTGWELDFINDMAELPDDYELSEKQNAIVNRISQKLN